MRKTTYLRFVAVFLAVLILSLPIYTSEVYAQSLSISKNSGRDNVQDNDDGYLRQADDVWDLIVNAVVPGQSVAPNQVKVNGYNFNSCTAGIGSYDCLYRVDYANSQLGYEGPIALSIELYDSSYRLVATKSATVAVDGSPPSLSVDVEAGANTAVVEMTVKDEPDQCAGLGKIEIYDAETNTLLKPLGVAELQNQITDPCGENLITTNVAFPASGNYTKIAKVIAYDRLNNSVVATQQFTYDYRPPVVIASSFMIGDFGNYLPADAREVDVYLNVTENGDDLSVIADSAELGWANEAAVCTKTNYAQNIFTCVWSDKTVQMHSSINLNLEVSDGPNTFTQSVSKTFVIDSTAPVISSFGTEAFEGVNYAAEEGNLIKVVFDETQSGLDAGSVTADLHLINPGKGSAVPADNCTQSGSQWICYWYNIDLINAAPIYLNGAQDRAGNLVDTTASQATAALVLDNVQPEISDVEVFATSPAGQVDFYQGQDILTVKFKVKESHGVHAQLDLSDVVNGYNVPLPVTCTKQTDFYECSAVTPHIKSGYDADARIKIMVSDFAGNQAEKIHSIEILRTNIADLHPDFWSLASTTRSPETLDLGVIPLMSQRVFFGLKFTTTNTDVSFIGASIDNCDGNLTQLNSVYMVNNLAGSLQPYLVFELKPFTEVVDELNYTCTLNLYSRQGNQVIASPEQEIVSVLIPFKTSHLGNELDTLGEKIEENKMAAKTGFYGAMRWIKEIIFWARLLCETLGASEVLFKMYDALTGNTESLRSYAFTVPAAIGTCVGADAGKKATVNELYEAFKPFCDIVTCKFDYGSKEIASFQSSATAYLGYSALGMDNFADPYSNMGVAIAKLCLPAILYNLDKLRQIQCRYVFCLEYEVKAGVADVRSCGRLKSYQECKYVWGVIFQVLPFVSTVDTIMNTVKSFVSDPIGVFGVAVSYACVLGCPSSNILKVLCDGAAWLLALASLANNVASLYTMTVAVKQDYCAQVGLELIPLFKGRD